MTYAHTSNCGVFTILNGLLLRMGTSPSESTLISILELPYTSSKPSDIMIGGTANGTRERISSTMRTPGRRICTQYTVGVTRITASSVVANASSSESSKV